MYRTPQARQIGSIPVPSHPIEVNRHRCIILCPYRLETITRTLYLTSITQINIWSELVNPYSRLGLSELRYGLSIGPEDRRLA